MSETNPKSYVVIANWKMNASFDRVATWSRSMKNWLNHNQDLKSILSVGICPSFPYLTRFKSQLEGSDILLGSQEVSEFDSGAYTGEVSAAMLEEIGCDYSIVGHSEARKNCKQTDSQIAAKLNQLIKKNITPILCVGESLEVREQNKAHEFVLAQLTNALTKIEKKPNQLIIAYEPIWAIGTGRSATSEVANQMHSAIYDLVHQLGFSNFKIIYGGSVNPDNAKEFFSMPRIEGALVGTASLDEKLFQQICGVVYV